MTRTNGDPPSWPDRDLQRVKADLEKKSRDRRRGGLRPDEQELLNTVQSVIAVRQRAARQQMEDALRVQQEEAAAGERERLEQLHETPEAVRDQYCSALAALQTALQAGPPLPPRLGEDALETAHLTAAEAMWSQIDALGNMRAMGAGEFRDSVIGVWPHDDRRAATQQGLMHFHSLLPSPTLLVRPDRVSAGFAAPIFVHALTHMRDRANGKLPPKSDGPSYGYIAMWAEVSAFTAQLAAAETLSGGRYYGWLRSARLLHNLPDSPEAWAAETIARPERLMPIARELDDVLTNEPPQSDAEAYARLEQHFAGLMLMQFPNGNPMSGGKDVSVIHNLNEQVSAALRTIAPRYRATWNRTENTDVPEEIRREAADIYGMVLADGMRQGFSIDYIMHAARGRLDNGHPDARRIQELVGVIAEWRATRESDQSRENEARSLWVALTPFLERNERVSRTSEGWSELLKSLVLAVRRRNAPPDACPRDLPQETLRGDVVSRAILQATVRDLCAEHLLPPETLTTWTFRAPWRPGEGIDLNTPNHLQTLHAQLHNSLCYPPHRSTEVAQQWEDLAGALQRNATELTGARRPPPDVSMRPRNMVHMGNNETLLALASQRYIHPNATTMQLSAGVIRDVESNMFAPPALQLVYGTQAFIVNGVVTDQNEELPLPTRSPRLQTAAALLRRYVPAWHAAIAAETDVTCPELTDEALIRDCVFVHTDDGLILLTDSETAARLPASIGRHPHLNDAELQALLRHIDVTPPPPISRIPPIRHIAIRLPTPADLERQLFAAQDVDGRFNALEAAADASTESGEARESRGENGPREQIPRTAILRDTLLRQRVRATFAWDEDGHDEGHVAYDQVRRGHYVVVTTDRGIRFLISDDPEKICIVLRNTDGDARNFVRRVDARNMVRTHGATTIHYHSQEQFARSLAAAIPPEGETARPIYPMGTQGDFPTPLDEFPRPPRESAPPADVLRRSERGNDVYEPVVNEEDLRRPSMPLEEIASNFATAARLAGKEDAPWTLTVGDFHTIRSGQNEWTFGGNACGDAYLDRLAREFGLQNPEHLQSYRNRILSILLYELYEEYRQIQQEQDRNAYRRRTMETLSRETEGGTPA
jgi:hypothetical protein